MPKTVDGLTNASDEESSMGKLEMLKRIGKVAVKVAGLAGADDKTKRLEAEKELLELRCQLGAMALADLIRAIDDAQARGNTQRVDESEVEEARAALELLRKDS